MGPALPVRSNFILLRRWSVGEIITLLSGCLQCVFDKLKRDKFNYLQEKKILVVSSYIASVFFYRNNIKTIFLDVEK